LRGEDAALRVQAKDTDLLPSDVNGGRARDRGRAEDAAGRGTHGGSQNQKDERARHGSSQQERNQAVRPIRHRATVNASSLTPGRGHTHSSCDVTPAPGARRTEVAASI